MTAQLTRLCGPRGYCSALRAGGVPGPLCPYCAHVDRLLTIWGRVLG